MGKLGDLSKKKGKESKKPVLFAAAVGVIAVAAVFVLLFWKAPWLPEDMNGAVGAGEVEIRDAEAFPGKVSLSVFSPEEIGVAIIQLLDPEGYAVCSKTTALEKGLADYEIKCPPMEKVSVLIMPEGRKSAKKDFEMEIPTLEFGKGMLYSYLGTGGESIDVYVTEESDALWKGVIATVVGNSVAFNEFELDREVLSLRATGVLKKEEVGKNAAMQPSLLSLATPFGILSFQQQFGISVAQIIERKSFELESGGQKTGRIEFLGKGIKKEFSAYGFGYSARVQLQDGNLQDIFLEIWTAKEKPYMLLSIEGNGEIYSLEKVEEREFSMNEYREFQSYEPPKTLIELAGQEVLENGQVGIALKNNYSKKLVLKYLKFGEQTLEANIALEPEQTTVIPLQLNTQAEVGQQYQFVVVTGIEVEEQVLEFNIVLAGEVKGSEPAQ